MSQQGFLSPEEQTQLNQAAGDGSGFDDSYSFETGDLDPNEVERGGWIDREGQYHFEITDVKFDRSKNKGTPYVELVLTVLHTVKGQSPEGSRFTHEAYFTENTRGMVSALAHRIGAVIAKPTGEVGADGKPKMTYIDVKTGKAAINKETFLAVKGSQFIGFVKFGKARTGDDGKNYDAKLELYVGKSWPVDSPEVADVPKNLNAMKLIGKVSAPPVASKEKTKTPPQTKSATSAPAATAGVPDDLSDL